MNMPWVVRAGKLITVSELKTIEDGALVIKDGMIQQVCPWKEIAVHAQNWSVLDRRSFVVTPSFVDCHTHLMEFAPSSIFPVTQTSHELAVSYIILQALAAGVTSIGEQICGHPQLNGGIDQYRLCVQPFPMDIQFSVCWQENRCPCRW